LSNMYPEAKSVVKYVKHGWHVTVAYIVGFFVMLGIVGWHPHAPHRKEHQLQQQMLNVPADLPATDSTSMAK
ncbi:MAG TPA: hypothetical protein PK796_02420, partial [Bacteroidales bacterium]|nr:hypothetical protein [Bacteroidales bacterium]